MSDYVLDKDDLVDVVQAFGQSQLTVFRASEEAKRRSAVFNHCVFPEMIFAINVTNLNTFFFVNLFDIYNFYILLQIVLF